MGMDLSQGGHLTHGSPANMSGKNYNFVSYGVSAEDGRIDYDALAKQVAKVRPKLLVAGASAYPRAIDFEKLAEIALLDDSDVILSEETDERLDRLMLLIEDLEPPIRQLIFRLRYLQEKSYQEVADEVGVSKVTVFNHLSKAMDWIKKQFK